MQFRVIGVDAEQFSHLYGLDDVELAKHHAIRMRVDAKPGFPDRIEMRDLEVGETALLVNYTHLDVDNPYRASHAIFVREGAKGLFDRREIPEVLRSRLLSVRAFDRDDMIVAAEACDGSELESLIERFLARSEFTYLHVHYAKRGCYAARIERVAP